MYKGFIDPSGDIITIDGISHLFWWKSKFQDLQFLSGGWVRWRAHSEDFRVEIEFVGKQNENILIEKLSTFISFRPKYYEVIRWNDNQTKCHVKERK